jgi:hypothetical protein
LAIHYQLNLLKNLLNQPEKYDTRHYYHDNQYNDTDFLLAVGAYSGGGRVLRVGDLAEMTVRDWFFIIFFGIMVFGTHGIMYEIFRYFNMRYW